MVVLPIMRQRVCLRAGLIAGVVYWLQGQCCGYRRHGPYGRSGSGCCPASPPGSERHSPPGLAVPGLCRWVPSAGSSPIGGGPLSGPAFWRLSTPGLTNRRSIAFPVSAGLGVVPRFYEQVPGRPLAERLGDCPPTVGGGTAVIHRESPTIRGFLRCITWLATQPTQT